MDNIITGIIGIGLFLAFIGGLAETIGAIPFILIVLFVGGMAAYDLYENIRDDRKGNTVD